VIRRSHVRACVTAAVLSMPGVASAQRQAFYQSVAELADLAEGIYGDEGSRIGRALDTMSRTLDEWDREIAALEARAAVTATMPAPARLESGLTLARVYADRGRLGDALRHLEELGRLDATQPDVQVMRGLLLEAAGNPVGAAEAFRQALAKAPDDPVAAYYVWRAAEVSGDAQTSRGARAVLAAAYRSLLRDGRWAGRARVQEIAPLEEATRGMPLLPLAAYRRGFEQLARGELREAIEEFRRAASTDALVTHPAAESSSLRLALEALRQGRLADARSLLEQTGAADDSSEARRVLGLVYWAELNVDRSVEQFEAAIRMNPADERSRLALSRVLSSAGRDAEAERTLQETIRAIPASARAHWWLATVYERVNRFAEARPEFELAAAKAVAGRSHLQGAVGRLASAAADGAAAVDAFSRAVAGDPDNPAWHKLLAGAMLLQDRPDEALAEFIAALLIDPRDGDAHLGIGKIYLDAGRNPEAVDALRRASELTTDTLQVDYALATALTRLGLDSEAAPVFARVEQVQRQRLADRRRTLSLDALREEAALRAAEGDHARASALWQQVIRLDGQRASDHMGLARALGGAGRLDAAIAAYERAAQLGADPVVYRLLADLYTEAGRAPDAARARLMYEAALRNGGPAQ
jgi:tetratricopeptide (TPR) repeat protein